MFLAAWQQPGEAVKGTGIFIFSSPSSGSGPVGGVGGTGMAVCVWWWGCDADPFRIGSSPSRQPLVKI